MSSGFKKVIFLAIPVFMLVTVYQNCGQNAAPSSGGSDSSQGTPNPNPNPGPLPNPSPVSGMQNTWKSISMTNAPTPRSSHTAVWSGSEMLVWGGSFTNTGGRYNPTTDTWSSLSTTNAPSARSYHRAVWTGSKMVVWGGVSSVNATTGAVTTTNTGGVYDPATDTWATMSTTGAPSARWYFLMAWTGSKVLVWGGNADSSTPATGGALYDPATNTWSAMPSAGAPYLTPFARAAVVGNSLVVFGGDQGTTGGIYDFASNSWKSMNLNGAPSSRYFPYAASTGSKAIFFGGMTTSGPSQTIYNTGGVYDLASNSWRLTSTSGAPTLDEDVNNVAVWTGSHFLVWGGQTVANGAIVRTNVGAFYDPANDVWTPTSLSGAPAGRVAYSTVWTGSTMIVYGGIDANSYLLNNGFILQ